MKSTLSKSSVNFFAFCTIFLTAEAFLWNSQVAAIDRTPPIDLFRGIRSRFGLVLCFCSFSNNLCRARWKDIHASWSYFRLMAIMLRMKWNEWICIEFNEGSSSWVLRKLFGVRTPIVVVEVAKNYFSH